MGVSIRMTQVKQKKGQNFEKIGSFLKIHNLGQE